ncbi:MAG: penicillin-binding protein 1A [Rickettsiaceae bacterium]|nr:penicillin-binding protein 1A [Rickettsiaceae bacterium]
MLRSFLKILKYALILFTFAGLVAGYLFYLYSKDLPDYYELAKYHPPLTTRIYTVDGKLIEQYAKEHRVFVAIESVPISLINAFIAAEDKNFYSHQGIDLLGLVRAFVSNINNYFNNKRLEGASTITQQVVKNLLLSNERSFERKIKEAILSYMVSNTFSKDQILELYLNQTYFGRSSYGIASAAQTYFNKTVEKLSLAESAFIAGLPKAPSYFDPQKNYSRAKARRDYVINRMLEDGYITAEQAKEVLNSEIKLKARDKNDLVKAGYFAEIVRNLVSGMFGEDEFYTEGYTVITTLDSELQNKASEAFVTGIKRFDHVKGYRKPIAKIKLKNWHEELNKVQEQQGQREYKLAAVLSVSDDHAIFGLKDKRTGKIFLKDSAWTRTNIRSLKTIISHGDVIVVEENQKNHFLLAQIPAVNGGMVVASPVTGAIKAHVGGYDFNANKFDRVTQAQRQPGSTIKSLIYLAALEQGIEPTEIFTDGPVGLSQGPGLPLWTPKNFSNDFLGDMTFRSGLEKSRNLVTVRVVQKIGLQKVIEMIKRLGVATSIKPYYSVSLGAIETTLSKMVNAYSMIANGGFDVAPQFIELIQDKNGKIIYRRDKSVCLNCKDVKIESAVMPEIETIQQNRVIDEVSAYQLTHILQGAVIRGTAQKLAKHKLPIASKTGTTNESFDTWNIAYLPNIIVGVYVGYDQPASLGKRATGSTVALPIVDDFFTSARSNINASDFRVPAGVKFIKIDKNTGKESEEKDAIIEVIKNSDQHNQIITQDAAEDNDAAKSDDLPFMPILKEQQEQNSEESNEAANPREHQDKQKEQGYYNLEIY